MHFFTHRLTFHQWITLKDTLSFGSKKLGRRPADCACSGPQAQDFLLCTARPACVTRFVHVLITLLYLYLIALHLVQKFSMKSGQLIFVLFFRPKKTPLKVVLIIRNFFNIPRRKNFKPQRIDVLSI